MKCALSLTPMLFLSAGISEMHRERHWLEATGSLTYYRLLVEGERRGLQLFHNTYHSLQNRSFFVQTFKESSGFQKQSILEIFMYKGSRN